MPLYELLMLHLKQLCSSKWNPCIAIQNYSTYLYSVHRINTATPTAYLGNIAMTMRCSIFKTFPFVVLSFSIVAILFVYLYDVKYHRCKHCATWCLATWRCVIFLLLPLNEGNESKRPVWTVALMLSSPSQKSRSSCYIYTCFRMSLTSFPLCTMTLVTSRC